MEEHRFLRNPILRVFHDFFYGITSKIPPCCVIGFCFESIKWTLNERRGIRPYDDEVEVTPIVIHDVYHSFRPCWLHRAIYPSLCLGCLEGINETYPIEWDGHPFYILPQDWQEHHTPMSKPLYHLGGAPCT